MDKSADAFRTISEVSDILETPAHVLRFWETRFPQIRPVKRAGGRRYYRPADIALLTGIKYLLHAEGMTIRGVQKILREHGIRHVAGLVGQADLMDVDAESALEQALAANFDMPVIDQPIETATIVPLETALWRSERAAKTVPSPPPSTLPTPSVATPSVATPSVATPSVPNQTFTDTMDDSPTLPGFDIPPPIDPIRRLKFLPRGHFAENEAAISLLARANALLERMTAV